MKKIVSFILCFVMAFSVFTAKAEETLKFTEEQYALLSAIGMYSDDVPLASKITRGEFADMLVKSIFDEPEYLIEGTESFNDVNEDNKYYMVAYMEERLDSIVHSYVTKSYITGVFQDWENGIYDGDGVLDYYYSMGLNIDYDPDYVSSFATSGAEVVYSNAVYGSNPELTFNSNYSKLKGSKMFQNLC